MEALKIPVRTNLDANLQKVMREANRSVPENTACDLFFVPVGNPTVPKALRAGVWEGLVNGSHTANAPLLICSPVTILSKPCDKQTCLTY